MIEFNSLEINVDDDVKSWHKMLFSSNSRNDFILMGEDLDTLTWFISNYTQYLINIGNNEVVPLYGQLISNLETFVYQINLCMPVGYRAKSTYEALYDLLLNFETEPNRRIIIWKDSDYLFENNKNEFEKIFELMVVTAFLNRNGISTVKEDGSRYTVDQRNFFMFYKKSVQDLEHLLNREYYIPSIDYSNGLNQQIGFDIVRVI